MINNISFASSIRYNDLNNSLQKALTRINIINFLLVLVATFFIVNSSYAQKSYTITGNIIGLNDAYILMIHPNADGFHTDSAQVKNGRFEFKGHVLSPTQYYLATQNREKSLPLYIENTEISIAGTIDSFQNAKIKGSRTHNQFTAINIKHRNVEDQKQNFANQYKSRGEKYEHKLDSLSNLDREIAHRFITENPGSPVSIGEFWYLLGAKDLLSKLDAYEKLFNTLDQRVKDDENGKEILMFISSHQKIQLGKPAPTFAQPDTAGKLVSLSSFKGKYVLIDFWASWCGPCRAENPNVLKAYDAYKGKNFTIIGISLDDKAKYWKQAIAEDKLP